MLVNLSQGAEIVALVPTLGGDTEAIAATVSSLEEGSGERRLGVLVIVNAPSFVAGPLDERVSPSELLMIMAQSAADAFIHLARVSADERNGFRA